MLACAAIAGGCATSPTSGRLQFNLLPGSLESTYSDLRFGVSTRIYAATESCQETGNICASQIDAEHLARRVAPIAERLGTVTPQLSPELTERIPLVEVFVVPNDSPAVTSSGGGKIAFNSGLARLDFSDTDLALALAREFGRLASAHHRESTSAGLAVSIISSSPTISGFVATSFLADLLFPIGSMFKVGLSLLGSLGTEQLVERSQQDEADSFAGKLMQAAGYDLRALAEALPDMQENAPTIGWLPNYLASRALVAGMIPPPPSAVEALAVHETAAGVGDMTPGTIIE